MTTRPASRWLTSHFWHMWFGVLVILALYALYLIVSGTPLTRTCVQWVNP